ncbi:hypothetical protein ACFS07_15670 [Undibacterium arcticum]
MRRFHMPDCIAVILGERAQPAYETKKRRNIYIHSARTKEAVMSPIKPYTVKSTSITLNNAEYDKYRPFGGYDEVKKSLHATPFC